MREIGNKSIAIRIIGILMVVAGVPLIFIGYSMGNSYTSFYRNLEYYYQNHTMDTSGKTIMIAGIIVASVGLVLILVSIYLSLKSRGQFSKVIHGDSYDEVDDVMTQLAGNRSIFDIFHSEDKQKVYSFYRDKTCILKIGDKVYRGKMEPLEWAGGRPTLWKITMDIDGEEKTCEISKVEGNILVKNDEGEEIFYRN